jgi:Uncharacterized phage-associated protein
VYKKQEEAQMAYPTIAVANAFIERAMKGQLPDLDPMKLQKLMFYAQSWNLKIYNEPLVDDFLPSGPTALSSLRFIMK